MSFFPYAIFPFVKEKGWVFFPRRKKNLIAVVKAIKKSPLSGFKPRPQPAT